MTDPPIAFERLEEMLRSLDDESWVLVRQDGTVEYGIGPRGGILGHGAREATHIAEWVHPDDLSIFLDTAQRVLHTPGLVLTERVRCKHGDGSWRLYDVTAVNRLDDPRIEAIVVRTVAVPATPVVGRSAESLVEDVPTPILVVDHAGNVIYSNDSAGDLVGDVRAMAALLADVHDGIRTLQVGDRWVQARVAARADGFVAMLDDITAQHHLATTDTLTGLVNRAGFDERLSNTTAPVAVVFVDLDGFKAVNDEHGHAAGDRVLRVVADRIRREVRPGDLVARFGGDEFAVVAEGLDTASADALAARLERSIGRPVRVEGARVTIGASAGVATSPPEPHADALVAAADRAMYARKSRD